MGSLAHAGTRPGIDAASLAKSHSGPPSRPTLDASRHRSARLAASLALALNVPGLVEAGTVTVTRCNDQDGIQYFGNSLRLAINIAVAGDTVDLSGLACSTITLERGELYIDKGLTLVGPTDHLLTIDANSAGRVINDVAVDDLHIRYLGLAHGLAAQGGCIDSAAIVIMYGATISGCTSTGNGGAISAPRIDAISSWIAGNSAGGKGGALFGGAHSSYGIVDLNDTVVIDNTSASFGGGIYSSRLLAQYSIISGNHSGASGGAVLASADARLYSSTLAGNSADVVGGGVRAPQLRLEHSTISGNSAYELGGLYANQIYAIGATIDSNTSTIYGGAGWAYSGTIINSTVSGNSAPCVGALISRGSLDVRNSTVAFNASTAGGPKCPGGILGHATQVISSIVAKNTRAGGGAADLEIVDINYDPGSLTASASLIVSSNKPSASLTANPLLGPLAWHGGATRTHALLPGSPAINAGTNPNALEYDARGFGFARSANGGVDIGAYERQVNDDALFYDGFD